MKVICPRCETEWDEGETMATCPGCHARGLYRGQGLGWLWATPSEPVSREWVKSSYVQAKAAMIELWTPPGTNLPVCAVCGIFTRNPHAHHVWRSQRYQNSHNDVRNLAPVCNETAGDCHQRAHGGKKEVVRQKTIMRLGEEDAAKGEAIIKEATKEWENYSS